MIATRGETGRTHVVMIGNNGAPSDRRLWLECLALRDAGMEVSVVCPERGNAADRERLQGIEIYRYRQGARSGRASSFVSSYLAAWWHTLRLTCTVWRRHRFHLIQACNPPDTFFSVAILFRLFGVPFVFDQHDLSPEIYQDRFVGGSPRVHAVLSRLERMSHRAAAQVITVNESCRDLLLARTATPPERLTVVRSGPDLARLRVTGPVARWRNGCTHLCAYLGVMGPQDDVDMVLRAVDVLVHDRGRTDVHFVLMGEGECLADLERLARELQVEDWVEFTGWADDATISAVLSTADLGLQPDRRTPFTDMCSMLKTIEYLAFGLPVVAFDLTETRRTVERAGAYVQDETAAAFGDMIVELLDDPARRHAMSAHAMLRGCIELAWTRQKGEYVEVIRRALGRARTDDAGAATGPNSIASTDSTETTDVEVATEEGR